MNRGREHSGMLARAIVVDRAGALAALHQFAKGLVADRPMRAAGKIGFVEPRLAEQAFHRLDMRAIAVMRGASNRKLGIAEPKRIGGPALDERNGLQRFHRGTREDRPLHVAERENEPPRRIGDGDRPRMTALDDPSPHHLDEHGIGGGAHAHAAAMRMGARRAPQFPATGSNKPGQGAPQATQRPSPSSRQSVIVYQSRPISRVAARRAIRALPRLVMHVAGIDVAKAGGARDGLRPRQGRRRRRRLVAHLPVGMERGEVERHVRPERFHDPFAESANLLR